jgi:polyhydroxyalkanoate synthesis regulator phasin
MPAKQGTEEMMQRIWKVVGIAAVVAVLGMVVLGAAAYAQDDEGSPFDFGARFREAVAKALGITVDEYDAAVKQAHEQVLDEAVSEGKLTEEQAERMRERMEQHPGAWGRGKGLKAPHGEGLKAPRGGFGGRMGGAPLGMVAEQLGMTAEDLMAEIQAGKSIAQVAEEQGVDVGEIVAAYMEQLEERLGQAVENGKITQEQADSMLEKAEERALEMLNNTWEGRGPGRFPRGFPGKMSFPGISDA